MQINLLFFIQVFLYLNVPIFCAESKSISDFKRGYFKIITANSGFHVVKTGLETLKDEIIVYNGYVNNDLYVDIVTFTKDKKTVNFYIFNDSQNIFEAKVKPFVLPEGEYFQSVKFMDIQQNQEWPNIVLISYKKIDTGFTTIIRGYNFIDINERAQLQQIKEFSYEVTDKNSKKAQEFFNFEIFQEDKERNFWLFMKEDQRQLIYWDQTNNKFQEMPFSDLLTTSCDGCSEMGDQIKRVIPETYTSGFVDLNQDCKSDIVLETVDTKGGRFLEFFYFYKGKFGFIKSVTIPKTFSIGTFKDINGNNCPDLTFFDSESKSLKIFLNNFVQLFPKAKTAYCLESFQSIFSFPSLTDLENKKYQIDQKLDGVESLVEDKENRFFPIPRYGDIDLDGNSDLILNVVSNNKQKTIIYMNTPCKDNETVQEGFCRFFDSSKIEEQFSDFNEKQILQTSFFDLGERGKLGFLIQYKEDEQIKIGAVLNNFEIENYFLKAIGFYKNKNYQNLTGATFNIKKTELNGDQNIVTRTQNHNCTFNQLCLPYVHFGLGKINNYIEDFKISVNREENNSMLWTPIIPNSQLIVYFTPGRRTEWNLNIFINPTSAMFFIFISTIIVLILIGVIILFLHCKEKKIEERFQMIDFNLI